MYIQVAETGLRGQRSSQHPQLTERRQWGLSTMRASVHRAPDITAAITYSRKPFVSPLYHGHSQNFTLISMIKVSTNSTRSFQTRTRLFVLALSHCGHL